MKGEERFIYYRVARPEVARVRESILAIQAVLRVRFPGLEARLLCRVDEAQADSATFMEIYSGGGLSAGLHSLQAEIEAAVAAALPWLKSERHREDFLPLG